MSQGLQEYQEKTFASVKQKMDKNTEKQVMLDTDVSVTKCNGNMITHYDIGKTMSSCNYDFANVSAKLLR